MNFEELAEKREWKHTLEIGAINAGYESLNDQIKSYLRQNYAGWSQESIDRIRELMLDKGYTCPAMADTNG